MTWKKVALLVGGGVLLLAVAVFLLLMKNLDSLVEDAIERSASAATGTAVKVGSVSISLSEGRGTIHGLTIANPPGFAGATLLAFDTIDIRLNPATLADAVPVIEEVRIGPGTFNYEINQVGENNLRVIQKQVRRQKAAGTTKSAQQETGTEKQRVRIKRLIIADSTATIDLGPLGGGGGTARIPGFSLTDLGGIEGATAEELATEIVSALGKNLSASIGDGALKRLGDSFSEAFRKARER